MTVISASRTVTDRPVVSAIFCAILTADSSSTKSSTMMLPRCSGASGFATSRVMGFERGLRLTLPISDISGLRLFGYQRGCAKPFGIAFSFFCSPENSICHVGFSGPCLAIIRQEQPSFVEHLPQEGQGFRIVRAHSGPQSSCPKINTRPADWVCRVADIRPEI